MKLVLSLKLGECDQQWECKRMAMSPDAAHQLNIWPGDHRGEWCMCPACVLMLTSPHFTSVWRGGLLPVSASERRRECSRLSTGVLWEPSPHTCYLIGPGGRRSERDPDSPTCSRQSRVHPSPPPLAKSCVNNTLLNDFLKLLAKCGEKTTPCYTSKLLLKLIVRLYNTGNNMVFHQLRTSIPASSSVNDSEF